MTAPQVTPSAEPDAYILVIIHDRGDDATLHVTDESARAALAAFARSWWHEIDDGGQGSCGVTGQPPADGEEAIRLYFDRQEEEHYSIIPASIPRDEPSARELADAITLDRIAEMLRDPEWVHGMLEDIRDLVAKTGRSTGIADGPAWNRR